MNSEVVDEFLLACHHAKAIIAQMPALPDGVTPRDVRICDTLQDLQQTHESVRVSDISARMQVTRPSITKAIVNLELLGYVAKKVDPDDRRGVLVELTDQGRKLVQIFVTDYHAWVANQLHDITELDLKTATQVIYKVEAALAEAKPDEENMTLFKQQVFNRIHANVCLDDSDSCAGNSTTNSQSERIANQAGDAVC